MCDYPGTERTIYTPGDRDWQLWLPPLPAREDGRLQAARGIA